MNGNVSLKAPAVPKWKTALSRVFTEVKNNPKRLLHGGAVFLLGYVLSRTHLWFGAYPFGIALVCALSAFLPYALLGCILGSLSLGRAYLVEAGIAAFAFVLRLFLSLGETEKNSAEKIGEEDDAVALAGVPAPSVTDKPPQNAGKIAPVREKSAESSPVFRDGEEKTVFSEPAALRISVAIVSGFLFAVSEILRDGFSLPHLLLGACFMLAAAVATLFFYWFFDALPLAGMPSRGYRETLKSLAGIGFTVFLLSFALRGYAFLGISATLTFGLLVTLFIAKKQGAPRALFVGFLSGLAVGTEEAVSLCLVGGVAGLFFPLGVFFTFLTGGILLGAWTFYQGGMYSFVDIFPEYALSCSISYPFLRQVKNASVSKETPEESLGTAVGGMVLSYKNQGGGTQEKLGRALASLAPLLDRQAEREKSLTREDCRKYVKDALGKSCAACPSHPLCDLGKDEKTVALLSDKLFDGKPILAEDFAFCTGDPDKRANLAEDFSRAPSRLAFQKCRERRESSPAQFCTLFSKLLADAKEREQARGRVDSRASEKIQKYFRERGEETVMARVLGAKPRAVFLGGYFSDRFTEVYVQSLLESALGQAVSLPTAHRKDGKTVFSCQCLKQFRVETAVVKKRKSRKEVSGDSFLEFESDDGDYYLCLSDGMGTGGDARATADFATGALRAMLKSCLVPDSSLYLLNRFLRAREEECSTTVDLFSLDLYSGKADFYKSGAAASFLRRGQSVFRIKSETMPLGLLESVDNERVHLKMQEGDTLILVSDGVCPSPEEAPWLSPLLSAEIADMKDYADKIMSEAQRNNSRTDDMTVVIARVLAA